VLISSSFSGEMVLDFTKMVFDERIKEHLSSIGKNRKVQLIFYSDIQDQYIEIYKTDR